MRAVDPAQGRSTPRVILGLDQQALNAASGPEVDHAFGLFVEDCKLFIDLANTPFMVGKDQNVTESD